MIEISDQSNNPDEMAELGPTEVSDPPLLYF